MSRFADRVYEYLRTVPKGRVTTYKAIGEAIGTRAYRAIGGALSRNPYAPEVACHRVVASNGTIGGFMGGRDKASIAKKIKLLALEGVVVTDGKVEDFSAKMFR